jgi:hypothetical protein
MKLTRNNWYKCDKCGENNTRERTASLSTNYQPTGLVEYKKGNLGVRHLCEDCKDEFESYFEAYFTALNKIEEVVGQDEFKCVICDKNSVGYGNNPEPVKDKGKCCDKCNFLQVIPARVGMNF